MEQKLILMRVGKLRGISVSEQSVHTVHGSEAIVRVVSEIGNGAHVLVPRKWAGETVTIIRNEG